MIMIIIINNPVSVAFPFLYHVPCFLVGILLSLYNMTLNPGLKPTSKGSLTEIPTVKSHTALRDKS